jgi:hypothetical protein
MLHSKWRDVLFLANESGSTQKRLTKRAPDAGDSAAISSSFLHLSIFLAGRLRRPRPSAGNANRWLASQKTKSVKYCHVLYLKYERNTCPNQKSRPCRTLRLQ